VDSSCNLEEDARPVLRTRGGLGSGLEMILPREVWVNAPVEERFAKNSPFMLVNKNGSYQIENEEGFLCNVILPPKPSFYDAETSTGKKMDSIGVMQGTYLGIYPTELCHFWKMKPKRNCRFCSAGLTIGKTEAAEKSVRDVVETVKAARREQGITFVHFNTGFMHGNSIDAVLPFVRAVKEETGLLVGVQCPPVKDFRKYMELKQLGVDHMSFCIELFGKNFSTICPGKEEYLGQSLYLHAIDYCSRLFGKGRVAGEVIAGLESATKTIEAIKTFARMGAVSTVCVFRPCEGTNLQNESPPHAETLLPVFAELYRQAVLNSIPINMAPNIKTAMVMLPEECKAFLGNQGTRFRLLEAKMNFIRVLAGAYFTSKLASK